MPYQFFAQGHRYDEQTFPFLMGTETEQSAIFILQPLCLAAKNMTVA